MKPIYIAIDFDGTIAEHRFPEIGAEVPGAFEWMKKFQQAGAKLILWTMRSDGAPRDRDVLTEAVLFCEQKGIVFFGVNENETQHHWTTSPKCYAHIYIDDAALGCPLLPSARPGARPFVDWSIVGPMVMRLLDGRQR